MKYTNQAPVSKDDLAIGMLDPLKLSFLAAVKRIDRLRNEVFCKEGESLITRADDLITNLAQSFKNSGYASVSDVTTLIKFAGYMNDYVTSPDQSILRLASQELGQSESHMAVA